MKIKTYWLETKRNVKVEKDGGPKDGGYISYEDQVQRVVHYFDVPDDISESELNNFLRRKDVKIWD